MIERTRWFDRTFTFDLPLWMYPNVVERLRGTPARVAERLAAYPPGLRTRRDAPTPLAHGALDVEQTQTTMRTWRPCSR